MFDPVTADRKNSLGLVAKNWSERHYIYEAFRWPRWRPELSGRSLSQDALVGSHQERHQARSRTTHPPPPKNRRPVVFAPDAGMPRINRGMVYLGGGERDGSIESTPRPETNPLSVSL